MAIYSSEGLAEMLGGKLFNHDFAPTSKSDVSRATPKIRTDFVYPPIPIRSCDWQAVYDDDEPNDNGSMASGHGTTEVEAVRDLITNHPRSGSPCPSCRKPFFDGDTCHMGGCPMGGDV